MCYVLGLDRLRVLDLQFLDTRVALDFFPVELRASLGKVRELALIPVSAQPSILRRFLLLAYNLMDCALLPLVTASGLALQHSVIVAELRVRVNKVRNFLLEQQNLSLQCIALCDLVLELERQPFLFDFGLAAAVGHLLVDILKFSFRQIHLLLELSLRFLLARSLPILGMLLASQFPEGPLLFFNGV